MAKRYHRKKLTPGLLLTGSLAALLGVIILLISWLPLHWMENCELLTHTGVFEQYYTEIHPSGRSTATYDCFVVNGETYYVSPITRRALDRAGVQTLAPGAILTLEYWAGQEARALERSSSDRELLSIASGDRVYMALEDCLQEKHGNGRIGIVLGCVFILSGAAIPIVELFINRHLYRPSLHKKHR